MNEAPTISMDEYRKLERQKLALRKQLIAAYDIAMVSKQPPKNAQSASTLEILTPVVSAAFDQLEAAGKLDALADLETVQRDGDKLRLYVPYLSRTSKYLIASFLIAWGAYCDRTGKKGFAVDMVDGEGTILFTTENK